MNPKVFHTLEFDKVITRLMEHASTERGKSYCQKLTPITNLDKITARQVETDDALKRIYRNGSISFGGVHDVTPFQKRLEIGGSLNAGELLEIASLLLLPVQPPAMEILEVIQRLETLCPVTSRDWLLSSHFMMRSTAASCLRTALQMMHPAS